MEGRGGWGRDGGGNKRSHRAWWGGMNNYMVRCDMYINKLNHCHYMGKGREGDLDAAECQGGVLIV